MSDPPIIYPWERTGWPIWIFKEKDVQIAKKHYICTRKECNRLTRVLRDPMQLECGDRVCEDCYDILLQIPAPQRICDACKRDALDSNTNTSMAAQSQRIDPLRDIQPKRTQTTAQTEDSEHQEMELDAAPQAVQSKNLKLEKSAWIIPEKCNPDRAAAMEINKLEVKCPYGCDIERVGTRPLCVRTLKKHMRECSLRLVACEYCADSVSYIHLQSHLSRGCPFRVVDCPNGCGKRCIQHKDLAKHLAECAKKPPVCRLCMNPFLGSHHSHLLQDCFASKCPLGCTDMRPGESTVSHLDDKSKLVVHFVALYDMIMAVKQAQETNQGGIAHGGMTPSQMTAILDRLLQLECRSEGTERLLKRNAAGLLVNAGKAESNRKEHKDLKSLDKSLANDLHMLSSNDKTFRQRVESVKRQEASDSGRSDYLEALSQSRQNEIEEQREALTDYQLKHVEECSQRLIACGHCTDRISLSELRTHLVLHTWVDCTNGCGTQGLQQKDLAEHYLVCPRRTSAAVSCTQDTTALPSILDKVTRLGDKVKEVNDRNKQLEGKLKETRDQLKETKDEVTRNKLISDAYTERKKFEAESGTASGSLVDIQNRFTTEDLDCLTAKSEYQKEDGKGTLTFGLAGADLQTCRGSDWKFSIPCCVKSSGLTFRVGVKPYGQAENSHMFVCFVRMDGGDEFDMQPEFNLQLTVALRNLETNKHIVKTFSPMVFPKPTDNQHVAYGCLKFVPRQKLETGNGYIKADMLILHISVREMEGGIAQAL